MKKYQIWSEGYKATGESGTAHLHTVVEAKSFEEAILKHAIEDADFYKHLSYRKGLDNPYSYWGCRLFDNENDARKSFG